MRETRCSRGQHCVSRAAGWIYARQRRHGFYYGDSTMWLRRGTFEALGGFRELAIMDDYDLVRRLEAHGRTAALPGPATTSARRWRSIGITRTLRSWWVVRWLHVAGVPAPRLARWHQVVGDLARREDIGAKGVAAVSLVDGD